MLKEAGGLVMVDPSLPPLQEYGGDSTIRRNPLYCHGVQGWYFSCLKLPMNSNNEKVVLS